MSEAKANGQGRPDAPPSTLLADGKVRIDHPAEHVTRLTIANPDKRNALDHAILDAIAEVARSESARCLLITGEGPVFSAGYDIGSLPSDQFAAAAEKLVAHPFHQAIEALEAYAYPVVAALNGHAIGGGLELALSCDLIVASEDAVVGMPPAKLGLIYSHTGLRKFVDAIGVMRTRQLFHVGRNISARRAESWGLVTEVVPAGQVAGRGVELAAEIAGLAPLALAGNKRILRELVAAEGALDEEVERELIALRESCFQSEDFFEGVRAFAEKRPPDWRGV
jgi:enoyl-CoA hydratase/carnithine racemase